MLSGFSSYLIFILVRYYVAIEKLCKVIYIVIRDVHSYSLYVIIYVKKQVRIMIYFDTISNIPDPDIRKLSYLRYIIRILLHFVTLKNNIHFGQTENSACSHWRYIHVKYVEIFIYVFSS